MTSKAKTTKEYIDSLPEDRKKVISKLEKVINKNLPRGFKEEMTGMICYVVPHSLYPDGYHCDPKQPLPFIGIASQKNYVAVYHMGLAANKKLLDWFKKEYSKQVDGKLDMGVCCIRFNNPDKIPYELIGDLATKITPAQWIADYERTMKRM